MKGRANCRVTILRGSSTNAYGDDVDDNSSPTATGVLASILEGTRRTYLPAEGAFRVVRAYSFQIGGEQDVLKGDRLQVEGTGEIFQITELSEPDGFSLGGVVPNWTGQLERTT